MTDKETIGVRALRDVIEAVRQEAARQNRTLSNMAGQALEDWCVARGLIKRNKPNPTVGAR